MDNYRKIWEKANGPIPIDENGRPYDIHHVNGDRNDNNIKNLKCVSLKEHFNIHEIQGDWGACRAIALRMQEDSTVISDLARKRNLERIKDGTHHFLKTGKDHHSYDSTIYRFENLNTGENIECTCADLRKKLNTVKVYLLPKGKVKSVKGWKIEGVRLKYKEIHTFYNENTKEIFTGTAYEFRNQFKLNQGNVSSLIKKKNISVKGWKILNT